VSSVLRVSRSDRLDAAGRLLDEARREIMLRRNLGLTKIYNFVNDPQIRGTVTSTDCVIFMSRSTRQPWRPTAGMAFASTTAFTRIEAR
jgi:hypothetical protein